MVERDKAGRAISHLVLILGVCIVAFPVYVTLIASTQTSEQIVQTVPMSLAPGGHMLETYRVALFGGETSYGSRVPPVAPMMWVSFVSAMVISLGKIAISLLSAFAFVYFRFPGRSICFWMVFVTLMLPVEVRIFPTYQVVSDLRMLNTYAGLTIPLIASATATFLFRQFFLTVPDELVEASRIDGAGPMRFFIDVLVPLSMTSVGRAVRDPVHLRLEPVPVAAAGHHRREPLPGGDGHQAHVRRWRRGQRVERDHGHRDPGDVAAGLRGAADAEVVRQGPGRHREMSPPPKRPGGRLPLQRATPGERRSRIGGVRMGTRHWSGADLVQFEVR
jgi:sn-glycerol 3-phosphate transport system permease protein